MCSAHVWSMSEMLEKLEAEGLTQAVSYLASTAKRYSQVYTAMMTGKSPLVEMNLQSDVDLPHRYSGVIERVAMQLGMSGVAITAQHLQSALNDVAASTVPVQKESIHNIHSFMNVLLSSFGNEMDGRKLFVMGPKFARYYDSDLPLFGEKVVSAFPLAEEDIRDAGTCLALGMWTASVFHLMRAAEAAAAVLTERLGGDLLNGRGEKLGFGGLGQQIIDKIDAMPRGEDKDAWLKLKTYIPGLNRGSRIQVAHPGKSFRETDAERLFTTTKAFMEDAEELLRTRPPH